MEAQKKRLSKGAVISVSVVFAVLLIAFLFLFVTPFFFRAKAETISGSENWMKNLPDDLLISDINLPGSHNSGTNAVQMAFFAKCQSRTVYSQLTDGIRFLDIRLCLETNKKNRAASLKLMHSVASCKKDSGLIAKDLYLEDVLDQCYSFLRANPTETIVFSVKKEYGDSPVAEFQQVLDDTIRKNEDKWLFTNRIPALSQARGKLILLRRYNDDANLSIRAGFPFLWTNQNGYELPELNTVRRDNGTYTLWVQDRYEYNSGNKWQAFLAGSFLEGRDAPQNCILLNYLSTKGELPLGCPYFFARTLNKKLMNYDFSVDAENPLRLGWIILDFCTPQLAEKIYSTNFLLSEPPETDIAAL